MVVVRDGDGANPMTIPLLLQVEVRDERDVVQARQGARLVASRLGFEPQDQTRIATAVSEVARNAVQHAGGGSGRIPRRRRPRPVAGDAGRRPGAGALPSTGRHRGTGRRPSPHGWASRRAHAGLRATTVILTGNCPAAPRPSSRRDVARIAEELAAATTADPFEELRRQNRELLLRHSDDLRAREVELSQLNRELEDTNRGVLALHKELDDRAESLKKAVELKTKFLSNVSHEFRTPLDVDPEHRSPS